MNVLYTVEVGETLHDRTLKTAGDKTVYGLDMIHVHKLSYMRLKRGTFLVLLSIYENSNLTNVEHGFT